MMVRLKAGIAGIGVPDLFTGIREAVGAQLWKSTRNRGR